MLLSIKEGIGLQIKIFFNKNSVLNSFENSFVPPLGRAPQFEKHCLSERVFSLAGNTITLQRSSLHPAHVDALIFLHANQERKAKEDFDSHRLTRLSLYFKSLLRL